MANDGDKGLPDTDDPFVLLGITKDADEKAIKQAYAKLIRRYRPDRAPSEFQRIHAAFEAVRAIREGGASRFELRVVIPEDSESDAPRPDPARDDVDRDAIAARLRDAWSTPDSAAAIVDELLDAGVPLDVLVEDERDRFLLLRHPRFSWTRIRRTTDLHTALAVWEMACDDAIVHDPPRAHFLLDDEHLRLDAADHLRVAISALRRIGALAWRRLSGIDALFAGFRDTIPPGHYVDHWVDSIGLEIQAARSVNGIDGPIGWLTPLLVASRIGSLEERKQLARSFLASLAGNVEGVLAELHHLQRRVDLGDLFELIYDYLPPRYYRLDCVPQPSFERLSGRLHRIGRQRNKWLIRASIAIASIAAGFVVGAVPVLGALAAGGIYLLATEERRYQREIRPRIARTLVRCAVTPAVIARWIEINPRLSGRLWMFDLAINADAQLYTLAMFAVFAVHVGELEDAGEDD